MRDVLEHVEARDTLGTQQRHRVGIGLLEERGDQIPGVHLFLLGTLTVAHGILEQPVEGQGLAGLEGLVSGNRLQVLSEEPVQGQLELTQVAARVLEDLGALGVVE